MSPVEIINSASRPNAMHGLRALFAGAALTVAAATSAPSAAQAASLQQVLNRGQLRVGIVIAAPWALRDADSGELTGFEVQVAKQLAADMGVKVEFVVYRFDQLIRAVESEEIDLVAAGLTITPERALHVNFSAPYATSGVGIATNVEATAEVRRLEDLDDPAFTIAVLEGSTGEELAKRLLPRAELERFDTADAAAQALISGTVEVYLDEEPVPSFLALEHPGRIDVPVAKPLLETQSAFAIAKGDPDFVFFLNAWITSREADTWLPTTHRYWFKTLRWRDEVQ